MEIPTADSRRAMRHPRQSDTLEDCVICVILYGIGAEKLFDRILPDNSRQSRKWIGRDGAMNALIERRLLEHNS